MNAILESGFSPPPRILRRPHGRARTGLPCRTIYLCIALDERPAGCIDRGGGGCRVAPPDRGQPNDQPNPEDYARRTLESAAAALRREIPGPELER